MSKRAWYYNILHRVPAAITIGIIFYLFVSQVRIWSSVVLFARKSLQREFTTMF